MPCCEGKPVSTGRKEKKTSLGTAFLIVLLLIGTAIIAYPSISNLCNDMQAARAIESYSRDVSAAEAAALEEISAPFGYQELIDSLEITA